MRLEAWWITGTSVRALLTSCPNAAGSTGDIVFIPFAFEPSADCGGTPREQIRAQWCAFPGAGTDYNESAWATSDPVTLEVPVLVLGDDGLADHLRRARAGEEVVVLIRPQSGPSETALPAKTHHSHSRSKRQFCGQSWAKCAHGDLPPPIADLRHPRHR